MASQLSSAHLLAWGMQCEPPQAGCACRDQKEVIKKGWVCLVCGASPGEQSLVPSPSCCLNHRGRERRGTEDCRCAEMGVKPMQHLQDTERENTLL